jgi:Fe-S cluster assembly protein SufD
VITVPAEAVATRPTVISARGEDAAGAAFGHTLIELEPHARAMVVLDHQGSGFLAGRSGNGGAPGSGSGRGGCLSP